MSKVTAGVTMSLDGFVAGPNQRLDSPFGDIDENTLHRWMFDEADKPEHKADMLDYLVDAGAFIMGSNMFVPKENMMTQHGRVGGATIHLITLQFLYLATSSESQFRWRAAQYFTL